MSDVAGEKLPEFPGWSGKYVGPLAGAGMGAFLGQA